MRQKEAERTCYTLYLAVHAAHAEAPHVWTDSYWTRILTSFMTSQPFSWRVVGITEAALRKFHEQDYQYVTGQKLQRAHLRQRIDTVRELLGRRQPMSQSEFIEYWIENDTTVLCGERENTANVPSYIEIENPDEVVIHVPAGYMATQRKRVRSAADTLRAVHRKATFAARPGEGSEGAQTMKLTVAAIIALLPSLAHDCCRDKPPSGHSDDYVGGPT